MACFIVAECGVNHNGDVDTAVKLIDAAIEAGASAVKFQHWQPETFPHLEPYRLGIDMLHQLQHYAQRNRIEWFCTPFDTKSVHELKEIGMTIWKIPSNRAVWDNKEMLEAIRNVNNRKHTIISCGCASAESVIDLCSSLIDTGVVSCVTCVSKYPTAEYEIDIMASCNCDGISDHSTCIYAPAVAVALGATVVEKHLTLNRNQPGPDHTSSLEPDEFKLMVKMIREVEQRREA